MSTGQKTFATLQRKLAIEHYHHGEHGFAEMKSLFISEVRKIFFIPN